MCMWLKYKPSIVDAVDFAWSFNNVSSSLRCLVEGKGDVAFIKHTIVNEYTIGEWYLTDKVSK